MIGVGLSATLSGGRKARVNLDPMPALDLNFAANRSLPADYGPTPSFSRASTGTYFNSSGVLTSAAVNVPRFDHVYSGGSWVSRGLLVEEQRTNLAQYSEDFTNAFWTKSTCTISSNALASPDGNTTADLVVEQTGTVNAGIYTQTGVSVTSGTTYTATSYVKANGRNILIQYFQSNAFPSSGRIAWFDLANKTTQVQSGVTASIDDVGNGWLRIRTTVTANASAASGYGVLTVDAMGSTGGYTGNGSSGFYIWGTQFEAGSFPTSYIPTTSASTTRSADVCQITGTNFSSFWNASEGSCIVEYDRLAPIGPATPGYVYPRTFCFYGGAGNSIDLFGNHGSSPASELLASYSASSVQFGFSANTSNNTSNGRQVVGFATKLNDSAFSYNGSAVATDTSCVVPSINSLFIGSLDTGGNILNGHISRLRYYPTRLPNATLQSLST